MLSFTVNTVVQKIVNSVKFQDGENKVLSQVLTHFKQGIRNGIYRVPAETVEKDREEVPWHWQIFYREGYAFGLACIHAVLLSKNNPDIRNKCQGFRIMHYTGYGFYKGIADIFHVKRIPFAKENWLAIGDFDCFSPLLIGGESFAKTMYCKHWDDKAAMVWEKKHPYLFYAPTAWHGCGRCLWFNFHEDYNRLAEALQVYSPATPHLTLGLGVAITLTQMSNPQKVLADINRFAPHLQTYLKKGAGLALTIALEEHSDFATHISELRSGELQTYWEASQQAVINTKRDRDWYENVITHILQCDN